MFHVTKLPRNKYFCHLTFFTLSPDTLRTLILTDNEASHHHLSHHVIVPAPVQLLALSQLLLDEGQLPLQELLLPGHHLQVELEAAHPLQLLKVKPASPPATHAIQDEGAANVNLEKRKLLDIYILNATPTPTPHKREGTL